MHKLLNAINFLAISNLHPIIIQQGCYAITRLLTIAGTQNNYQLRIETIRIEKAQSVRIAFYANYCVAVGHLKGQGNKK